MISKEPRAKGVVLSVEQVRGFLAENPDFFKKNPDIMAAMAPPERELGDGVIDFQHFMVKNLQKDSKSLQKRYDMLIDFCRENMSVQAQVHQAALRLVRAKGLEALLEVITLDLVSLFDVDVVRMAMESDVPVDTSYGEQHYSGFVFIPPGTVDAVMGERKNVLLVDDVAAHPFAGFEDVFADCEGLVASCALLRLELETVGKHVLLAFGVRYKERFHTGQGIELLHFLAQIVAYQLDAYLLDLSL
ncbi:MAG: DUF484 family protein [Rickettsiales bacterium]|nr:DUF484 family protein [Rickettsiales bacterium]